MTRNLADLARDVDLDDTEIWLKAGTIVPCVGFGMFTGCDIVYDTPTPTCGGCGLCSSCQCRKPRKVVDEDKFEIFAWRNVFIEADGTVKLQNVLRGLNWYGCDMTPITSEIKEHKIGDEVKLADASIHYYKCIECQCRAYEDLFTLSADEGPTQQISKQDDMKILGGAGITTVASDFDTVTIFIPENGVEEYMLNVVNDPIPGGSLVWNGTDMEWVVLDIPPYYSFSITDTSVSQLIENGESVVFLDGNVIEATVLATDSVRHDLRYNPNHFDNVLGEFELRLPVAEVINNAPGVYDTFTSTGGTDEFSLPTLSFIVDPTFSPTGRVLVDLIYSVLCLIENPIVGTFGSCKYVIKRNGVNMWSFPMDYQNTLTNNDLEQQTIYKWIETQTVTISLHFICDAPTNAGTQFTLSEASYNVSLLSILP